MWATLVDTIPLNITRRKSLDTFESHFDILTMELDQGVIRYQITGKGPNLVIACDPPSTLASYQTLLEILANDFRVVVFEQPGFGFSYPKNKFDFSFDSYQKIFSCFLDRLNLNKYILSLPCVAGFSAIELANLKPDKITHIVLIQTPSWKGIKAWATGRDRKRILRKPIFGQLALMALKKKRAGDWYSSVIANSNNSKAFSSDTLDQFNHGACFCLASAFQKYIFSADPTLTTPSQPTLSVWGGDDKSHSFTDIKGIKTLIPHATCVTFDDCGHSPEIENPLRFSNLLKSFIFNSNVLR
jgi:pimeloyl-ACP methyl ester carboxylesterase